MRRIPDRCPDDSFGDPRAEPWWDTLDLAERIGFELAEAQAVLGRIGVDLRTPRGRPLRWMQQSVDCAFADVDRILQKLGGDTGA